MQNEVAVGSEAAASFRRDGFAKVERVISREHADRLRNAIALELAAYEAGAREDDPRYIFARSNHILEISNLFNIIPELSDLSLHRRLATIAAQLVNATTLRVYHDSLLYKTSAHPVVPWHQDGFYAVIDGQVIAAWMPLVPVDRHRGSVMYARGSGRLGLVNCNELRGDGDISEYIARLGYDLYCPTMEPGDVLFHHGHVFHSSGRTEAPRIAYSMFFFEDGARIQRSDAADMIYFPGCKVGDLAATELNPIVYGTPA